MNLDKVDYEILRQLQQNSDISMHELGARVGLSHTPCWRRVKKLEDEGVIKGEVRLLDPMQLGLPVNVFVNVTLRKHQENALARFESATLEIPEIVECYLVSGDTDFLLRVVVGRCCFLRAITQIEARASSGSRESKFNICYATSEVHDGATAIETI